MDSRSIVFILMLKEAYGFACRCCKRIWHCAGGYTGGWGGSQCQRFFRTAHKSDQIWWEVAFNNMLLFLLERSPVADSVLKKDAWFSNKIKDETSDDWYFLLAALENTGCFLAWIDNKYSASNLCA